MMTEKQKEFFEKLQTLFKEYDAYLCGCGCCGSPFVEVDGETYDNVLITKNKMEIDRNPFGDTQ